MSEPIKVLIMDTVMDRGGSEAMTMNFMRNMDRTKVQYDFLVHRDYKGAYEDEIKQLGGKIYRICPVYPQYFGRYKKEIRNFFENHPEYRIIHSNTMELGYFAYKEASKQGIPVIICHSHCVPVGFNLKQVVRWYFKHRMQKYITTRFACSVEAARWLFGEKNVRNTKIIKNPIEARKYKFEQRSRDRIRREFSIENNTFVVGHVGRFFPEKNHDFLIDIFDSIHKKNPNTVLMLVGSGENGDNDPYVCLAKEKIQQKNLENSVIFTGVRNDVPDILQAMDAFVFPSKTEGFGIALIEAQASGLRCFTSAKVVPKDVKVTDLLEFIDLNDSSEIWANSILQAEYCYPRDEYYKQIIKAGYDIEDCSKKMQEFYCNVIEGVQK